MSDDELFDLYLSENESIITSLRAIYEKGKIDAYDEVFNLLLNEENKIVDFADRVGIKILKLKGEHNDR